jgi:uncharacterized small protein (DUF1192 family)
VGRATIQSEGGAGRYTISLDYGTAEINAEIAVLNTRIAELDADIAQLEAKMASEQSAVNALWAALDAAIAVYKDDRTDENRQAIDDASTAALEGSATYRAAKEALADRKLRRSQLATEKSTLASEVLTETRSAWCVDYTEQATGAVATIELNGEGPEVLLAPSAPAPVTGDGVMKDRLAMSGAATFLNAAILPGWQKYSPTFRAGVITALDRENDTCSVRLEAAASSAQSLDINQASNLTDVPIEYMTCNAAAFVVGDEVVVQFENQDWSRPKVIGFRSNPRQCGPARILLPLRFISKTNTPYFQSAKVAATIWAKDNNFTPCVSGDIYIRSTGGTPPPGYRVEGQVQNAFTTQLAWKTDHSSGIIASADDYGDFSTFEFTDTYTVAGSEMDVTSAANPSASATQIEASPFSGMDILDVTSIAASGSLISAYEANLYNVSYVQNDTEANQPVIDCVRSFLQGYLSGVPSTINIQPASGGGSFITYELYRFFSCSSWDTHPTFPTTFAGLCLGYRRMQE